MKFIFLWALCLAGFLPSFAQSGFVINGHIKGDAEGMKVFLRDNNWEHPGTLDSAVIHDGKFKLTGSVPSPAIYSLIIDKTPAGEKTSERNWLMTRFYIENSVIGFSGNIDSLPTYFYNPRRAVQKAVITGSATEQESQMFNDSLSLLTKANGALDQYYTKVYHIPAMEGIFRTHEGKEITKAQQIIGKLIHEFKWNYIASHPESTVSYDQAM